MCREIEGMKNFADNLAPIMCPLYGIMASSNESLVLVGKERNLRKSAAGNGRKIRKRNEPLPRNFTD